MHLTAANPDQTQALSAQILKLAQTSQVNLIALYGDLGSGKTTFTQGLAKHLGIKKDLISPTFVLVRSYKINHQAWKTLHHVDLYRLESAADIKSIDLQELWQHPQNLMVIEWAEKAQAILPQNRLDVKFEIISDNQRHITVQSPTIDNIDN